MSRRIVRRSAEIPPIFPDSIHPVLRRVYCNRGVTCARDVETRLEHLHTFHALRGVERAVSLLVDALERGQHIVIVADFDADGATSCATAVLGLRALGAARVSYVVPNRFEFGYGLTPEIVEVAAALKPDVLVTVDNGIASVEGVAAAKARGMTVIVTDHHLPGDRLPDADAIVNPNQYHCEFPSKHLAGVGVMFYVLLAVRARLRADNWFGRRGLDDPNLAELLDLVALGTVADVVRLDHCNRILVAQGLARIQRGRCRPGILALLRAAGRDPARVVAADMGFAVGPRLNAAGRLQDMSLGIECLLTDDPVAAHRMALELDRLNRERRQIERDMKDQAEESLESLRLEAAGRRMPVGVCLYDSSWHQGVIGIVASRIKERYHRPVIAFADANEREIKGSARSIAALHIRDALDHVSKRHPELLSKFGGHAMAAGLSLERERFDNFAQAFDDHVRSQVSDEDLCEMLYSDGELSGGELTLDTAELLRTAGPWGQGFPEPLFDGVFEICDRRIVGERHLKLRLRAPGGQGVVDAIAFNILDEDWPSDTRQVQVAYRLEINEYNGRRAPQLRVEYVEPV